MIITMDSWYFDVLQSGCSIIQARPQGVRAMKPQTLKSRVTVKPDVCGGKPCIRNTRIEIAVILDGLAEGLTEAEIIDHYPQRTVEDLRAALAYAAELSHGLEDRGIRRDNEASG